jgi:hypothetical protein
MKRSIYVAAAAAVIAATGGIAATMGTGDAAESQAKRPPSLTGSGQIYYRYSPHDNIHFTFNAHGNTIEARGTFSFTHQIDGKGKIYRAYAKVDCLITGGHVATVTGVVTKADAPDFRGKRVGITVEDNGRKGDRLGFSWGVAPNPPQRCLGTAPFTVVKAGNYRVHDAPFTIPGDS